MYTARSSRTQPGSGQTPRWWQGVCLSSLGLLLVGQLQLAQAQLSPGTIVVASGQTGDVYTVEPHTGQTALLYGGYTGSPRISDMAVEASGTIVAMVSTGNGVTRNTENLLLRLDPYNGSSGVLTRFDFTDQSGVLSRPIYGVAVGPLDRIWVIGDYPGSQVLYDVEPRSGFATPILSFSDKDYFLQRGGDSILRRDAPMAVDAAGHLLIGGYWKHNGVTKTRLLQVNLATGDVRELAVFCPTPSPECSAGDAVIRRIVVEPSGTIWAAVGTAGLYRVHPTSGEITPIGDFSPGDVVDVALELSGTLLVTLGGGAAQIYRVMPETGAATLLTTLPVESFNQPIVTVVLPGWCATLGDNVSATALDKDTFTFTGQAGEHVRVRLEANPRGHSAGSRARLVLSEQITYEELTVHSNAELPNEVSVKLPASGDYRITVQEVDQAFFKSFQGDYCLRLSGTTGVLTPIRNVE